MSFKKENGKIYNNPAVFGPMLCELQDMDGKPYSGVLSKVKKSAWNLTSSVKTKKAILWFMFSLKTKKRKATTFLFKRNVPADTDPADQPAGTIFRSF